MCPTVPLGTTRPYRRDWGVSGGVRVNGHEDATGKTVRTTGVRVPGVTSKDTGWISVVRGQVFEPPRVSGERTASENETQGNVRDLPLLLGLENLDQSHELNETYHPTPTSTERRGSESNNQVYYP